MNTQKINRDVEANGRRYRIPSQPTVAICIDGSEPGYIESAIARGLAPNLDRLMKTGSNLLAASVIPSFTNPNNISIITGRPPAVHGIAGNYFYDAAAGAEVMMNDVRFMRADTIMKALHDAGAKVAVVTAKDKLRTLLGKGLDPSTGRAIAFSSEKADKATKQENGIGNILDFVGMKLPDVYSADLSEFVFAAGVKLVETFRPDVMYLSTTDYIQHKARAGFRYRQRVLCDDRPLCREARRARLRRRDHRRSRHERQAPCEWRARRHLSAGLCSTSGSAKPKRASSCRSLIPTSPITARSAPLQRRYLPSGADQAAILDELSAVEGVEVAITRDEACKRYELPADRIGDVVIISTRHKVHRHEPRAARSSGLNEPLRSHGGLTEQVVPMIVNRKVVVPPAIVCAISTSSTSRSILSSWRTT